MPYKKLSELTSDDVLKICTTKTCKDCPLCSLKCYRSGKFILSIDTNVSIYVPESD